MYRALAAFLTLLLAWPQLMARADTVTRVLAWGNDAEGQTQVPATLSGVTAIAAGDFHALALRSDGTVIGWGDNLSGQASPPHGLKDVKAIAAGGFHSLALRKDGSVVAWGRNDFGQCKVPRTVTVAIAIAAGENHSMALLFNGKVVSWGQNSAGQCDIPEELPPAVGISALGAWSAAELPYGRRAEWGDLAQRPIRAPATLPAGSVTATSASHGIALLKDGSLFGWGYNESGQSSVPTGIKKNRSVAVGKNFSLALVELETQTVKLDPIGAVLFQKKPLSVQSEASSHLPVTLSSSNPEIVSCENEKLVLHKTGLVTITASQPGNNQYAPASAMTLMRVGLGPRVMRSFDPLPTLYLGMHPHGVELKARVSAGDDPIIYTSSNPKVARIEGNKLYTIGIGRARISAQAKQSQQYCFTPALYQTVEVAPPSNEQLMQTMFANRTFEGEANYRTTAGTAEKLLYKYTVAFDGAIYGRAERRVWNNPVFGKDESEKKQNPDEVSKVLIFGSVKPPFTYKVNEQGRIVEGRGVNSLKFAKGLFSIGALEFRDGLLQFKNLIQSLTRGYLESGTCQGKSEPPPVELAPALTSN
jgi:hypothetical protein